jgi:hypothetical protein
MTTTAEIPTRVSIEQDDAGHEPYVRLVAGGHDIDIFLSGVRQKGCITADRSEGFVKRFVEPIVIDGDQFRTEIIHGEVEFKLRSPGRR